MMAKVEELAELLVGAKLVNEKLIPEVKCTCDKEDIVQKLHELVNKLPRYRFSNKSEAEIPENGIYIFFEEGEKFKQYDRIVRVGTHEKAGRLYGRLFGSHFSGNKDSSSFRKYLQEALLADKPDFASDVEKEVSNYLKEKMSFVVFKVENEEDEKGKQSRLFWEKKIVLTLDQSADFKNAISANWLGRKSPRKEIQHSGLWQVQGLKNPTLTPQELEKLKGLIQGL